MPSGHTHAQRCLPFDLPRLGVEPIEEAEKSWRRIKGASLLELLLKGIPFKDGEAVLGNLPPQQELTA
ncbi:MAG: hypothetical protein IDH49_01840 [Gammaproteobacteria bacterium]|nr:hypothetical protein [Gammaproteobacteria bacterium]